MAMISYQVLAESYIDNSLRRVGEVVEIDDKVMKPADAGPNLKRVSAGTDEPEYVTYDKAEELSGPMPLQVRAMGVETPVGPAKRPQSGNVEAGARNPAR